MGGSRCLLTSTSSSGGFVRRSPVWMFMKTGLPLDVPSIQFDLTTLCSSPRHFSSASMSTFMDGALARRLDSTATKRVIDRKKAALRRQ